MDVEGPWLQNPSGTHRRPKRKEAVPRLNSATVRLGGIFLPVSTPGVHQVIFAPI